MARGSQRRCLAKASVCDLTFTKLEGKLDWVMVDITKLMILHCKGNQGSPGHGGTEILSECRFPNEIVLYMPSGRRWVKIHPHNGWLTC